MWLQLRLLVQKARVERVPMGVPVRPFRHQRRREGCPRPRPPPLTISGGATVVVTLLFFDGFPNWQITNAHLEAL